MNNTKFIVSWSMDAYSIYACTEPPLDVYRPKIKVGTVKGHECREVRYLHSQLQLITVVYLKKVHVHVYSISVHKMDSVTHTRKRELEHNTNGQYTSHGA